MLVFDFDNTLFKYNKHYVISFTKRMLEHLNLNDECLIKTTLRFANTLQIGQFAVDPHKPLDVHAAPEFYHRDDDDVSKSSTKEKCDHYLDAASHLHCCSSIFNIPQYAIFMGLDSFIKYTTSTATAAKKLLHEEYNCLDFFKKMIKTFHLVLDEMFTLVCANPSEYGHLEKLKTIDKYHIITASKYEQVHTICQKMGLHNVEITSAYGCDDKFSPYVLGKFTAGIDNNNNNEEITYFGDNYIADLHTLPKHWRGVFVGDSSTYILGRYNRILRNIEDF